MTGETTYTSANVDAVIEIGKVRKIVHAHPLHRFLAFPAGANRRKLFTLRLHYCVAVHTSLCGGNIGIGRSLNCCVTVAAIDSKITRVQLMTIWNGLMWPIADIRVFRGAVVPYSAYRTGDKQAREEKT